MAGATVSGIVSTVGGVVMAGALNVCEPGGGGGVLVGAGKVSPPPESLLAGAGVVSLPVGAVLSGAGAVWLPPF